MLRSIVLGSTMLAASAAFGADVVFETEAGAIRGYDPVAYHLEGRPVKGEPDVTFRWQGAEWHFASVANRDAFAADPNRFAPRYGGFCAYGTSRGYKVSTDPDAFSVVDGVLYLNYSLPVQRTWNKDRPGYIRRADTNWITLREEPYESDEATIERQQKKATDGADEEE